MKKTLVVAIALASIAAFAQNNTTTETAAPATTSVHETKAEGHVSNKAVKKMKKKKTKAGASIQAAPASASVAQAMTPAPAATPIVAMNPVTETGTASAPAAGTSTASTAAAPADAKKWSVSLVAQSNMSNENIKDLSKATYETINYIGAGYAVTKETKLGLRQYFSYNVEDGKATKAISQWTVPTVSTKFKGIAGSDDIAPLFWYYAPTQTALKNVYNTDDRLEHYGILRMDAEVAWTLTPKWTVSYYLNPRQSMAPKQSYLDTTGASKNIESTTTLIHYGYVYYNVSDAIQPYGYVGMDSRMTTRNFSSIKDHALIGIGAGFTMFGGKFILNPEISNEVALKDNGEYASAPRWFQSDDMNYQMTAVVAF